MSEKPTYEELEKRILDLEAEILEVRQSEESIRDREARLRSMANQVPEMLYQFCDAPGWDILGSLLQ